MGKRSTERRLADNEAKAFARTIRTSPRKLNLVAQMIRGKAAGTALADLTFSSRRVAKEVRKVLDFIEGIKESGRACIYIEHNIANVHEVADRLVVIDRGEIVGNIPKGEMSLSDLTAFLIDLQTERESVPA